MTQKCFNGHGVVYQSMSGGKEWWCETCQSDGPYDWEKLSPVQQRAIIPLDPDLLKRALEYLRGATMPNVDKTNEQEPTEGPKSASGVSSADDTAAEESTTNRLLELESKFSDDVRIYPGEIGELIVEAFGFHERVSLRSMITNNIITHYDHVISNVYNAVEDLRRKSNAQQAWHEWLKSQGWS